MIKAGIILTFITGVFSIKNAGKLFFELSGVMISLSFTFPVHPQISAGWLQPVNGWHCPGAGAFRLHH